MTATSTEQRTPSSYAFLKSPFLRWPEINMLCTKIANKCVPLKRLQSGYVRASGGGCEGLGIVVHGEDVLLWVGFQFFYGPWWKKDERGWREKVRVLFCSPNRHADIYLVRSVHLQFVPTRCPPALPTSFPIYIHCCAIFSLAHVI